MIAKLPTAGVEASPVDFDTIIVGAGISGVNAAYRLQEQCPDQSYTIIEGRSAIGGTWDLFKYPGLRSDSDLHTFGFSWRPWSKSNTIADAPSILQYMKECVEAEGIDKHIQFNHKMVSANWSTSAQAWSLRLEADGQPKTLTARFLMLCTGYYDYSNALPAKINGIEKFQGTVIHPQFWPQDLDYTGKNIVVIGSGATAITLIPNLTDKAAHVTMLQRSPSYVMTAPREDASALFMKRWLPTSLAYTLIRLKWIVLPFIFFKFCRAFPGFSKKLLQKGAQKQLPPSVPVDPHFSPSYGPWEQRLCVCPAGDFYKVLKDGSASIVTAHIDKVTEKSIILKDTDQVLRPDIIVTATGLKVLMGGGAKLMVDGEEVPYSRRHVWKGAMLEGVPNMTVAIGYTNASWTLGADATANLTCRIMKTMKKNGNTSLVPAVDPSRNMKDQSVLNLNSTYVLKAAGELPLAGDQAPWLPRSTYMFDIYDAKYGSITTDVKYT